MGSSPKQPPPPDYERLANQQAEIDRRAMLEQTIANRPNQYTPMGSVQWVRDPATGQWTQTETWNPQVQQAFDQSLALQNQALQQAQSLGQQSYNPTPAAPSFTPYQTTTSQFQPSDFNAPRFNGTSWDLDNFSGTQWDLDRFNSDVVNNLPKYDQASGDEFARMYTESLLNRIQPQQQRDAEAMESRLRMQGLQPGTEAYDRAYRNLLVAQGDVLSQAQLQGMMAGSQEARNVFGAELQGALARAQEERNLYNTQLQGLVAQGDMSRADYLAQLQGQTARGEHARADNAQQVQNEAVRQQNMRDNFQTQLGYDQTMSSLNNYNYQSALAGQAQQYEQNLQNYLMPWQQTQMMQQLAMGNATPSFSPQNFVQSGHSPGANQLAAAQQRYAQQMQQYNEAVASRTAKGSSTGALVGGIVGTMAGGNTAAGAAIGGAAGGALFSDERIKSDLEDVSDEWCYRKMRELVPTSWRWDGSQVRDMGVSAQRLQEVLPSLVKKAERGLLTVNYTKLFAILLGAFRYMATMEEQKAKEGSA